MTCREKFKIDHPNENFLDHCPHEYGYAKKPHIVKDPEINVRVCNPGYSCIDCWEREVIKED